MHAAGAREAGGQASRGRGPGGLCQRGRHGSQARQGHGRACWTRVYHPSDRTGSPSTGDRDNAQLIPMNKGNVQDTGPKERLVFGKDFFFN